MPPIILNDVSATELIFENSDQNGNFYLPIDLSFRGLSGRVVLNDKQIIALAITEFCYQINRGKVLLK